MVIYITLAIAAVAGIYSYNYLASLLGRKPVRISFILLGAYAAVYALYEILAEPSLFGFIRSLVLIFIFYTSATLPLCLAAFSEDVFYYIRRLAGYGKRSSRSRAVFTAAIILAISGVTTIIYGMVVTKTDFKVYPFEMKSVRIPENFDGLRIVQISDLHLGSFPEGDKDLPRAFEMINALKPDAILLTGDILNDNSRDMRPWIKHLKSLEAPMGKYAVLGNHDYCEYDHDLTEAGRKENMDSLASYYAQCGFRLLDDENAPLSAAGDTIYVAGVENWGLGPFPARGDIEKALSGIPDDAFTILMSHDPAHFEKIVSRYPKMVDITLSGHTHAMQFGFEFNEKLRWSPIKYRSPHWAGPYMENGRTLYVNRGLGFHFFPARVGIRPEITLITLKRQK